MRPRVRRLIVALIVLSVIALVGGVIATRTMRSRLERELSRQAVDLLPDVAQRIQNFHRMKVDKGRKIWEVSAKEARYHADENLVIVTEPSVAFYMEDGDSVAFSGHEGEVRLDGHELDHVDLTGDIRMQFGEYSMQTESARYDRKEDTIVAPGHVALSGAQLDVQGDQLELDLSTQRLHLHENVRVVMRPSSTPRPKGPA